MAKNISKNQKAISLGVSKINVNTECQLAFQEATRKYIEAGKDLEYQSIGINHRYWYRKCRH